MNKHIHKHIHKHIAVLALAGAIAAASGPAVAAGDDHKPLHGGVFVEGKQADFELVATPGLLQLYVRDHGKSRDLSKASAKLTLLAGTDKQDIELKPAGDKLEATGNFKTAAGTKAVVVLRIDGKPASTARFTLR